LSQKVNFNHFYSLTRNILFDTLAQSLGTSDVQEWPKITWSK